LSWSTWSQAMSGYCSSPERPFWKAPGVTTTTATLSVILMAFGNLLIASGPLDAHTRVWVTIKCELRYDPDGSMIEVRHAWTFDDVFSTLATLGLETKKQGEFSREDLAPLAEVNVNSLKQHGYFTYAKVNGTKSKELFGGPEDYWLDYDAKETVLTLHFTLPFKAPMRATNLEIEVYDPDLSIEFAFAEQDPVRLTGAPSQCKVAVVRPNDANFPQDLRLDRFSSDGNAGMGAQFANRIAVNCP
jgi:ABC-type uncharacterized transport system substrate-binding protein